MHELLGKALVDSEFIFRHKWTGLIEKRGYSVEVARFEPEVRRRHMALWDELIKALTTNKYEVYLTLVEAEGRLQARANSRVEALVGQLSEIMNLIWEVISTCPAIECNPSLLRPLTSRLNTLRSHAETAMMKGFMEESRLIQDERAAESHQVRRARLEGASLRDLIKSIKAFRISRHQQGQLIFQPNDERSVLYFVLEGRVRLYEILPDARAITYSILSAGDVFAQSKNRENYFHDIFAEAMSSSTVACIQEQALSNLMEDSPILASRIIDSFSQQLSQSQLLIEGLIGRDVAIRVANLLLKLAREFGVTQQCGAVNIELGLTHQELADMIGSNRVTVTRKLTEFQKKKLIEVERGTISIVNKKALEALVA
jgi:CRP/FNR family transcriptional regulator